MAFLLTAADTLLLLFLASENVTLHYQIMIKCSFPPKIILKTQFSVPCFTQFCAMLGTYDLWSDGGDNMTAITYHQARPNKGNANTAFIHVRAMIHERSGDSNGVIHGINN
jgi:hypothetical protein